MITHDLLSDDIDMLSDFSRTSPYFNNKKEFSLKNNHFDI